MNKVMIFDLDDTLYDQLSGFEYARYIISVSIKMILVGVSFKIKRC